MPNRTLAIKEDEYKAALENLANAMRHLEGAIAMTEQSRAALHDMGQECWVDKLDHENGC